MFSAKIFVLGLVIASTLAFVPESSAQVTFSVFTDPHSVVSGGTIGFAFAGDKFVGSVQADGQGVVLYSTDLLGSNVQPFAPTVSIPASWFDEHPVASSLGLGGFPRRDIYVGAGTEIVHITHDGTKSSKFVTGLLSNVNALRFDAVGTFGHDLLVGTLDGHIYRVDSEGVPTLLASVGELVEGLDIAPFGAKFGAYDGQLIVTAEYSGFIRAIDWSGKVTVLNPGNRIPSAESINFVPLDLGKSGTSIEGFYQAHYAPTIVKADGVQFSGFKGDAIVSGEFGDLWRIHWNGTAFEITIIAPNPGQVEDGIFVTPGMIDPPTSGGCSRSDKGDGDDKHHRDDHGKHNE